MVLITSCCTVSWTSVHSSSGTLSIRSICQLHCIIIRDLVLVIPECPNGFPYFLQFNSESGDKEFIIWAMVISKSSYCWLYRASPSSAAKNQSNFDIDYLVMTMCRVVSYSWKRVFAMSRYLLTPCFCIPVPYDEKDIFFVC